MISRHDPGDLSFAEAKSCASLHLHKTTPCCLAAGDGYTSSVTILAPKKFRAGMFQEVAETRYAWEVIATAPGTDHYTRRRTPGQADLAGRFEGRGRWLILKLSTRGFTGLDVLALRIRTTSI
jgi:hypothetical protein